MSVTPMPLAGSVPLASLQEHPSPCCAATLELELPRELYYSTMTQVVNSGTGGLLSTLSKFSTTTKRNSGIGSRHTERNREPVSLKPDWRLGTRCSEHVAKEYEKYTWWGERCSEGEEERCWREES